MTNARLHESVNPSLALRASPRKLAPRRTIAAPISSTGRCALLAGLAVVSNAVLSADAPPQPWKAEFNGPADSTFRIELHERIRGEFVDWFGDPVINGKPVSKESVYNFVGNKFQLGVRAAKGPFEVFAQFQDTTMAALRSGLGRDYVFTVVAPNGCSEA